MPNHEQLRAELRATINAIERDLSAVLAHYARAGVTSRILLHAIVELTGSLLLGTSGESIEARQECQRLVQSLQMITADTRTPS